MVLTTERPGSDADLSVDAAGGRRGLLSKPRPAQDFQGHGGSTGSHRTRGPSHSLTRSVVSAVSSSDPGESSSETRPNGQKAQPVPRSSPHKSRLGRRHVLKPPQCSAEQPQGTGCSDGDPIPTQLQTPTGVRRFELSRSYFLIIRKYIQHLP